MIRWFRKFFRAASYAIGSTRATRPPLNEAQIKERKKRAATDRVAILMGLSFYYFHGGV